MNSASLPSFSIRPSSQEEVARLLVIWRSAVEATHHFLTASDLAAIERQVAEEYLPSTDLLVAAGEHDIPIGFMGLTGAHIGALFVDPALHGCGVGRLLIEHAGRRHPTLTVDVNEQNEGALGFYERLGFHCRRARSGPKHQGYGRGCLVSVSLGQTDFDDQNSLRSGRWN